jgi:hypothetical protein
MCNVINLDSSQFNITDPLDSKQVQSYSISMQLEINVNVSFQMNSIGYKIVNLWDIQSIENHRMKFNQLNLIVLFNFIL